MGKSSSESQSEETKIFVIIKILTMRFLQFIYLIAGASAGNIVEELSKAGATTLISLVQKAGLVSTLEGEGPFTVFAPDNKAFAALPASLVNTLMEDTELLKTVLLNHVVPGKVLSTDLATQVYHHGQVVKVSSNVAKARVIQADIIANNGVIHAIDTVI